MSGKQRSGKSSASEELRLAFPDFADVFASFALAPAAGFPAVFI